MTETNHTKTETKHGTYQRTVAEKNAVVWCPECGDPMHLKDPWPSMLDGGEPVPECPDCHPGEWIEHASVKIAEEEAEALVP